MNALVATKHVPIFDIFLQGEIQKKFLGGGSTKKCDHNCDQALMKSSWGSV